MTEQPNDSQSSQFNPDDHTVEEVVDYLENADADEVERVQKAEADGQDRKGISSFSASSADDSSESDNAEASTQEVDRGAKDYDHYKDPAVPSSAIAQVIAVELQSGKSPTLDAVKDAAEQNKK
jgi:hypothetical protein